MDPSGPPSALAPLSDTRTMTVLSRSFLSSRNATSRPIWASVCERNPAKHSMKRLATVRSVSPSSSHAGTHGGRGDRRVPGGITPKASCRA